MSKNKKLNSMRFLEAQKVVYQTAHYDDSLHDAVEVAHTVGKAPHTLFKTLVVDTGAPGKPLLALIPAPARLDLKLLAKLAGFKKLSMATHADAEKWTGLQTGGISPLALTQKRWPIFIDESVNNLGTVTLSAGQRGTQIELRVEDFFRVLNPTSGPLTMVDE